MNKLTSSCKGFLLTHFTLVEWHSSEELLKIHPHDPFHLLDKCVFPHSVSWLLSFSKQNETGTLTLPWVRDNVAPNADLDQASHLSSCDEHIIFVISVPLPHTPTSHSLNVPVSAKVSCYSRHKSRYLMTPNCVVMYALPLIQVGFARRRV